MKIIAVLVVLLFACASIAGCATVSVHAKVNPDTTISNYSATIETTSAVYGLIGNQLMSNFDANQMNYSEQRNGDNVTITITAKNTIRANDTANWSIKKVDNHMVYFDSRLTSIAGNDTSNAISETMLKSVAVHYYLEMPGKITSSNANTIDNTRAEWHLTGGTLSTPIRAESEVPILPSLPGFGAVLALLGITGAFLVLNKRG